MERIADILRAEPRIGYAVLFGSVARGTSHTASDIDVAIGVAADVAFDHRALGRLVTRLESAAGRPVDVVVVREAPCPLAFRIFRDGRLLFERDHRLLADDRARAALEYFDFRPFETLGARGVLAAAADDR